MMAPPLRSERTQTSPRSYGISRLLGGALVVVAIFIADMMTEKWVLDRPQVSPTSPSGPSSAIDNLSGPSFTESLFVNLLIDETNEVRRAEGLTPLLRSEVLSDSAGYKLDHMVRRGYWSHDSSDGRSPWFFLDAAEYAYSIAGENLTKGFRTPNGVVTGWQGSASHRANLLAPGYTEIGVAVRYMEQGFLDGDSGWVVVAHYARPR